MVSLSKNMLLFLQHSTGLNLPAILIIKGEAKQKSYIPGSHLVKQDVPQNSGLIPRHCHLLLATQLPSNITVRGTSIPIPSQTLAHLIKPSLYSIGISDMAYAFKTTSAALWEIL